MRFVCHAKRTSAGRLRLREISVNLYIVRQSNSIIILLFVQSISKFLTSLPPRTSFKILTPIDQYFLPILAFLHFSLSQKFSYFNSATFLLYYCTGSLFPDKYTINRSILFPRIAGILLASSKFDQRAG